METLNSYRELICNGRSQIFWRLALNLGISVSLRLHSDSLSFLFPNSSSQRYDFGDLLVSAGTLTNDIGVTVPDCTQGQL